jgi:2-polyprenyl-3-methyl-5-hydroxy-6-metoxy-1,4-benzoquinol methylase
MQYNPFIDLSNQNSSRTIVIQLVGYGKNVLDVGCARGNVGSILATQFNCIVSGIELDPNAAELAKKIYHEVVVGDVEDSSAFEQLRHGPFDVIVFGDVLEHLRQPEIVLRASRSLLKKGGFALIALPNVVTLRLRLRFLLGQFEYTDQGIMDRTHLRFFTLKSARELILAAGYHIERFEFVVGPNFGRRLKWLRIPRHWLRAQLFGTKFIFEAHVQEQ